MSEQWSTIITTPYPRMLPVNRCPVCGDRILGDDPVAILRSGEQRALAHVECRGSEECMA